MNVLILGSGGREHAFAYQISKSKLLTKLYIAPGNAGTSSCGTNIQLSLNDFEAIRNCVISLHINFIVVGPEDPLVNGIVDFFENDDLLKNITIIGPSKKAAQLEGSKDFSKKFMMRNGVPTAAYKTFNQHELNEGIEFLKKLNPPYVLKADGLAAGKGVIISSDINQAIMELTEMLQNLKFGNASSRVVIEEFLDGIELSTFVLTNGTQYIILPEAKDYKRIGDADTGLNTGGMGAVSPVPFADQNFMKKVHEKVVIPTIKGLQNEQIPYLGFLFIGLMNINGEPYVIEYNCRMGDPETEVVLPRIKNDFLEILQKTAAGKLNEIELKIDERFAATMMLVSGGYPEDYKKGFEISGLDKETPSLIFHAGTKFENNKIVTNGGRVLAITSFSNALNDAFAQSYKTSSEIYFSGKYNRTDLGKDLIKYL
ncbi:MAG TPA: phosphoribosylamine--glycine ligase [Bacteroidia bacterium]|nr:phosphoribosylamine--glycine ligase [Bacteroidia bacterium]